MLITGAAFPPKKGERRARLIIRPLFSLASSNKCGCRSVPLRLQRRRRNDSGEAVAVSFAPGFLHQPHSFMEIWGNRDRKNHPHAERCKELPAHCDAMGARSSGGAYKPRIKKTTSAFRKCRPLLLARFICAQEFLHLRRISHQLVAGFTIGLTVE